MLFMEKREYCVWQEHGFEGKRGVWVVSPLADKFGACKLEARPTDFTLGIYSSLQSFSNWMRSNEVSRRHDLLLTRQQGYTHMAHMSFSFNRPIRFWEYVLTWGENVWYPYGIGTIPYRQRCCSDVADSADTTITGTWFVTVNTAPTKLGFMLAVVRRRGKAGGGTSGDIAIKEFPKEKHDIWSKVWRRLYRNKPQKVIQDLGFIPQLCAAAILTNFMCRLLFFLESFSIWKTKTHLSLRKSHPVRKQIRREIKLMFCNW